MRKYPKWNTSGPGHKAICYDDEGSLECVCELRISSEHEEAELLSQAEAFQLLEK